MFNLKNFDQFLYKHTNMVVKEKNWGGGDIVFYTTFQVRIIFFCDRNCAYLEMKTLWINGIMKLPFSYSWNHEMWKSTIKREP